MLEFSVTKHGKPLDESLYDWNEETKTFSSDECDLVLDFNTIDSVTFTTGWSCTFTTGWYCNFKTAWGCTFDTGSFCTFDTHRSCTFKTGGDCTFTTGNDCVFHVFNNGTFIVGKDCFVIIRNTDGNSKLVILKEWETFKC